MKKDAEKQNQVIWDILKDDAQTEAAEKAPSWQAHCSFPPTPFQIAAQKRQWRMPQFFGNDRQIDKEHQRRRDQRGFDERIGIPKRLVGRQAVAVIVHGYHHILKQRIAEQIANCRREQRNDHRHREIVPDQLSFGKAGRKQRANCFCFFVMVLLTVTAKIKAIMTIRMSSSTPPIAMSLPISSVAKWIAGLA